MAELSIWKNQEINQLRREMERTFRRFCDCFGVPLSSIETFEAFPYEMTETEDALIFTAEIPGLTSENLNISLTGSRLLIRGERKETLMETGTFYQQIRHRSGTFSRSFSLPCQINTDEVDATFKDNQLKIIMPKAKIKKSERILIDIR